MHPIVTRWSLRRSRAADRGQGLVEYALILALVAVVCIGILLLLGTQMGTMFSNIHATL